jgi:UDP-glucuronate 4-epimerase
MAKILITGGAGFIGSHLIEKLLKDRHHIYCLDNFSNYYDPKIKKTNIKNFLDKENFKLVIADIRDKKELKRIFKRFKFDRVVHLAAQPGVKFSLKNPSLYMDINISGTLNILDACRDYKIKGLIFGSSSSVYGNTNQIPSSEEGELKPISPYGISKLAAERLCYCYNQLYHLSITILRLFTVYGPRQRPDMAIYKFIKLINENKEIKLYGNGKTKRDYTYISDIVDGIISALKKDFNFEIINLGNSQPIVLYHIISLLEKNLNKKAKIKYYPEQPSDPSITFADISKAKKLLNYRPKVKIQEGIKRFMDWYKHEKT